MEIMEGRDLNRSAVAGSCGGASGGYHDHNTQARALFGKRRHVFTSQVVHVHSVLPSIRGCGFLTSGGLAEARGHRLGPSCLVDDCTPLTSSGLSSSRPILHIFTRLLRASVCTT